MTPKINQKNQPTFNAREQPSVDSLVKIRTKCQHAFGWALTGVVNSDKLNDHTKNDVTSC